VTKKWEREAHALERICQHSSAQQENAHGSVLAEGWMLHVKFQVLFLLCGQKFHEDKILEMAQLVQRAISSLW